MAKQSGKFLIFIIFLTAIAGGYWYWTSKDGSPEPAGESEPPLTSPSPPYEEGNRKEISPSPSPTPRPSVPPPSYEKIYESVELKYQVRYPANWSVYEQQGGAFVDFGPGKVQPGDGVLSLDMACVYAAGFEEGEGVEITHTAVTYGTTTYDEHKVYTTQGGKKQLTARYFEFEIRQSAGSSPCQTGSFIVRRDLEENVLKQILASFVRNI